MSKNVKVTPMMVQYLAIKAQHQDAILFFRMGDFYEMFFEDAKTASAVLGITLTSRAHGKSADIPLAGFPYHSLDTCLSKMIKAGHRVAICEQMEDPKTAKTLVKRDVTEIVTPGTVLTDDLLDSKRNNFLCSIYSVNENYGLAVVDISTGEFSVDEVSRDKLLEQLGMLQPAELLVSDEQADFFANKLLRRENYFFTKKEDWIFSRDYGYETLTKHFGTLSLKGFGCDDMSVGISAAGAILHFLKEVQKNRLAHITQINRQSNAGLLQLDVDTCRNLELLRSMRSGRADGTLLSVIDKTHTSMGGRKLIKWVLRPLRDPAKIRMRLDAVEEIKNSQSLLRNLAEHLSRIGDLERFVSKITTNRASARDLNALKDSLLIIPLVKSALANTEALMLSKIQADLYPLDHLVAEIETAIVSDPPLSVTDGGIIRSGFDKHLDELREISFSGKDWIARLQKGERDKTGISSLKVSFNKVFGYYIEVTKPNLSKVPEYYIRKQTLVNAERFITPDLKEYEEKVLDAEEKIASIEYELFDEVRKAATKEVKPIQASAQLIGTLDCLLSFAKLATENKYIRPEVNDGSAIEIVDGRHPVVEKLLPYGETFIVNDTSLDSKKGQIAILTGPNMAGKSTYLRQVGLIVLLAQMGSFVPAKRATIGVVDRVFTRVGASDNLAGGESTFLVEMNETANILNNATPNSLVLLDEIGRGTSTFDGLSIAWAVAEYLHNTSGIAAKTIFATHYHELTELELILPRVKNYNVVVKEWGDRVVFLRKIAPGSCDHSYGIQVAKLAGLPRAVIRRAKEILSNLERDELTPNNLPRLASSDLNGVQKKNKHQMDIFETQDSEVRSAIQDLDIEGITPLEALLKLNELKRIVSAS